MQTSVQRVGGTFALRVHEVKRMTNNMVRLPRRFRTFSSRALSTGTLSTPNE